MLQQNGFRHAPSGDWAKAHSDVIINYITWDNTQWTAIVQDGGFLHAPGGNWEKAHSDDILNYMRQCVDREAEEHASRSGLSKEILVP